MQNLTPEGLRIVTDVATRHRVSLDAAITMLGALAQGNGRQAQFNHPDLGGLGQWSQGGMIMAEAGRFPPQSQSDNRGVSWFVAGAGSAGQWWPAELGSPATTGAQNDMRYACFPGPRRLAIQQGGKVRVYDTGEHRISEFSQQQGDDQSLTFTSQYGLVPSPTCLWCFRTTISLKFPLPPLPRRPHKCPDLCRLQWLSPLRRLLNRSRWRTS